MKLTVRKDLNYIPLNIAGDYTILLRGNGYSYYGYYGSEENKKSRKDRYKDFIKDLVRRK